jgi:hypothetical protein
MSTVSTIYDVQLMYSVKGNAGAGLSSIAGEAEKAAQRTAGLGDQITRLGALVGGGLLLSKGKDAFIGFNKEVENSKISIAAISNMFNGGSFAQSMQQADDVFRVYQKAAIQSTATTADFLEMHKMIAPVMTQSGASMKTLMDTVQGATVAAPIFGVKPEMLAIDIRQMLQGAVGNKDLAANIMISSLGLDKDTFNQKARANVGFAIETVNKALTSPSLKAAAKAYEGSFAGVSSTLEDTVQILAGHAGEKLFQTITTEIKSWNEWLTQNRGQVDRITDKVSGALVGGFRTLKDTVIFIVDHHEALIKVAEVWAGMKAGSWIVSDAIPTAKSFGQMIGDGIAGKAGVIGAAIGAAIGLGIAAKRTGNEWDDIRSRNFEMRGQSQLMAARGNLNESTYGDLARRFIVGGAYNPTTGDFDQKLAASILRGSGDGFTAFTSGQRIDDGMANMYARNVGDILQKGRGTLDSAVVRAFASFGRGPLDGRDVPFALEREDGRAKQEKKPGVVVNINRVEVQSDDPDRFVMGIVAIADRAESRAGQARSAIPLR